MFKSSLSGLSHRSILYFTSSSELTVYLFVTKRLNLYIGSFESLKGFRTDIIVSLSRKEENYFVNEDKCIMKFN